MKYQGQYFVTLLIVGQLLTKGADSKPITRHCGKLPVEKRNGLLRDLSEGYPKLHWSFSLLPSLQQAAKEELPHADSSVTKMATETLLYGENGRICPRNNTAGMKLCPVHYVIQSDENRIPENIVHVRCNCEHCSRVSSSILTGKCVKEYAYTPVWRRTESDCEYKRYMEHVAVACVCKMKTIRMIPA